MHGVKVVGIENGPNNARSHITDAGLANFEDLNELAQGTRITDAGLVHLSGLKELDWLCLKDTRVQKSHRSE